MTISRTFSNPRWASQSHVDRDYLWRVRGAQDRLSTQLDHEPYPEALALTPDDDSPLDINQALLELSQRDAVRRQLSSHPTPPSSHDPKTVPSSSNNPPPQLPDAPSSSDIPSRSRSASRPSEISITKPDTPPATSSISSSTIYPSDSLSNRTSISASDIPTRNLRPVPDLTTLFAQLIPVLGDTPAITFGKQPPPRTVFDPVPPSPSPTSIFSEKPITSTRRDRLPRERDLPSLIAKRGQRGNKTRKVELKKVETAWNGRRYSVNPEMKTRDMRIQVLERHVGHGELLGWVLSDDARRDALRIGGTIGDVGGGMALESPKRVRREGLKVPTVRGRSRSPGRDGLGVVGPAGYKRKRESDDETRLGGRMLETGRYGLGGVMLWRIVRVGAVVGDEEHVAWWCVPDKAMGGFF